MSCLPATSESPKPALYGIRALKCEPAFAFKSSDPQCCVQKPFTGFNSFIATFEASVRYFTPFFHLLKVEEAVFLSKKAPGSPTVSPDRSLWQAALCMENFYALRTGSWPLCALFLAFGLIAPDSRKACLSQHLTGSYRFQFNARLGCFRAGTEGERKLGEF